MPPTPSNIETHRFSENNSLIGSQLTLDWALSVVFFLYPSNISERLSHVPFFLSDYWTVHHFALEIGTFQTRYVGPSSDPGQVIYFFIAHTI